MQNILYKEKLVIVRLMLREGHVYANESPSLCMVTTWTFSSILHTSYRDPWWRQVKSSYQWSTASARGKRGPSLAGTLVTDGSRSAAVIQAPSEIPLETYIVQVYICAFLLRGSNIHSLTQGPFTGCYMV